MSVQSQQSDEPAAPVGVADVADVAGVTEAQEGVEPPVEAETGAPTETATASPDAAKLDDPSAFLADLARSMQTAAGIERTRLEEDAERRRAAHVEGIGARRASEAAEIRELAATDLKAIDDWAAAERQRIARERDQRAAALQEDLEASLTEHGAGIDREITAVEAAVVAYRADVDRFFTDLDKEDDPVEIARQARLRPRFPDLDAVSASEAASAAQRAEPSPVGVMDAEAAADPANAWSQWNETATPATEGTPVAPESPAGAIESTADVQPTTGSLLQSVTTYRPFGGLGGDHHDE